MGGEKTSHEHAAGASSDADALVVAPLVGDEFVVVEQEHENLQQADRACKEGQGPSPVSPAEPANLGANLSASAASTTPSQASSSPTARGLSGDDEPGASASASTSAAGLPRFDAAADALLEAVERLYEFFYAYAAVAIGFFRAHGAVAFEFLYAHAAMAFEFVYAYATGVRQEALALVEKACSWAKSTWRRLEERSPASAKRAMRHSFFPALVAVGLSILLVLPAYWAVPRGGVGGGVGGSAHRMSAQEWQAKHDLLSNKHTAETVRQHLKYDSLAGRHLELQQDYEALLKDFKNQQRVYRAARSGPKVKTTPQETTFSKTDSLLGPVKDAFKVAEQSAYEYISHFSEGLREDVREIAERYFGKKNQEGGGGGGRGRGGSEKRDGEIAAVRAYQEEVSRSGDSKKEEKELNKMAERMLKLSREMDSLKAWVPESNFKREAFHSEEVKNSEVKNGKSKDKKPAMWGERESGKGDRKGEQTAESKESKAEKKGKTKDGKTKDGKSKGKKSEIWGEWDSAKSSKNEEKRANSEESKAAKKVKTNDSESKDGLLQEYLNVVAKDKKAKKVRKDKKDKQDKDVRSKEGKHKQAKLSQKSVPERAY